MTWDQLVEWQHYAVMEPWGEQRADLRMGILASLTANANRDPKRTPKPFQPVDFMPDFSGDRQREQRAKAKRITSQEQWDGFRSMLKG